jgi:hypothetical protein
MSSLADTENIILNFLQNNVNEVNKASLSNIEQYIEYEHPTSNEYLSAALDNLVLHKQLKKYFNTDDDPSLNISNKITYELL